MMPDPIEALHDGTHPLSPDERDLAMTSERERARDAVIESARRFVTVRGTSEGDYLNKKFAAKRELEDTLAALASIPVEEPVMDELHWRIFEMYETTFDQGDGRHTVDSKALYALMDAGRPPPVEPEGAEPVCARCGGLSADHPEDGWVRFEWADTARPDGWWYYRAADLSGASHLRRDHSFEEQGEAPEPCCEHPSDQHLPGGGCSACPIEEYEHDYDAGEAPEPAVCTCGHPWRDHDQGFPNTDTPPVCVSCAFLDKPSGHPFQPAEEGRDD